MQYYATVFDQHYLPQAETMIDSLVDTKAVFHIYVMALDDAVKTYYEQYPKRYITLIPITVLEEVFPELYPLKATRSYSEYIFTLSPLIPLYLLGAYPQIPCITTLDADLYFFSDPWVLFQEMGQHSVMISPHRFVRSKRYLERYGKYNVSFQSFRNDARALRVLQRWKDDCITQVTDRLHRGQYADQKYLDTWIRDFDGVHVIQHPGACLAPWNIEDSQIMATDGVLSQQAQPLIFYHMQGFRYHSNATIHSGLQAYGVNISQGQLRLIYAPYVESFWKKVCEINPPSRVTRNALMTRLFKPDISLNSTHTLFVNTRFNQVKLNLVRWMFGFLSVIRSLWV